MSLELNAAALIENEIIAGVLHIYKQKNMFMPKDTLQTL